MRWRGGGGEGSREEGWRENDEERGGEDGEQRGMRRVSVPDDMYTYHPSS